LCITQLPALSNGGVVWVDTDITRLVEAEERARELERELLQAQKMESIGTLAGGIAHEINTPIQYIGDNLRFIGDSIDEIMTLMDSCEQLAGGMGDESVSPELAQRWKEQADDSDLEFIRSEIPTAVGESIQGVKQVSKIILAMKEFAHPSSKDKTPVDINRVIERSLTICKNEFKSVANIELHLADNLPSMLAHESDLNQVILNLIVNSAHAIREQDQGMGQIDVTTQQLSEEIVVTVKDNGCGIPEDFIGRIFDPFFTTKEVGGGSGQGLAICYDIIVNKHGGRIDAQSVPGEGTTLKIVLPVTDFKSDQV
jgi:signal transduction histidine kinase